MHECEKEICTEGCDEISFMSQKILDLNKKLIESEKLKTRFMALVASELNNPMTALLGIIPHLMHQKQGEEGDAICELVYQEVLTLDFRIQNVVAAAQIEGGSVDVTNALVDPATIIEEVLQSLKYLIREKGDRVTVENGLNRKIVTDPQKLYLIAKNLIANGCIHGKEGGEITVSLKGDENVWKLEITNEGTGPDVDFKPQVFMRFAEGPDGKHGLGIGLSIVRDLSEHLDGTVDYHAQDGRVTFTVTFPLESGSPDSEACGSNEFLFEQFDDTIEF
jgi:signal transduction histidine kinase